jgi:hypothetical protein
MLAISELHTPYVLYDTPSRWLARNGLALRIGRVPSVRRYLEAGHASSWIIGLLTRG